PKLQLGLTPHQLNKDVQAYRDRVIHQVPHCCFQKQNGEDGNNCQVSKTEFLTNMNTELAAFTKKQDPDVLDHMMKKLALNSYGQLDFQEFLILGYRVP
ncbi:EF-hand-like domain containing protein, partial [Cricetulus griseus]